jgi:hypothetical protein
MFKRRGRGGDRRRGRRGRWRAVGRGWRGGSGVCNKPEDLARRVQFNVSEAETGKLGGEEMACAQILLNGSAVEERAWCRRMRRRGRGGN